MVPYSKIGPEAIGGKPRFAFGHGLSNATFRYSGLKLSAARIPADGNPKEKKPVAFTLPASDLAFYDEKAEKFVVEPGACDAMIGSSSEDIRLKARLDVR